MFIFISLFFYIYVNPLACSSPFLSFFPFSRFNPLSIMNLFSSSFNLLPLSLSWSHSLSCFNFLLLRSSFSSFPLVSIFFPLRSFLSFFFSFQSSPPCQSPFLLFSSSFHFSLFLPDDLLLSFPPCITPLPLQCFFLSLSSLAIFFLRFLSRFSPLFLTIFYFFLSFPPKVFFLTTFFFFSSVVVSNLFFPHDYIRFFSFQSSSLRANLFYSTSFQSSPLPILFFST